MSLPQVGLEAVIAGLPGFEAGASAITKAYDDIEKKGANVAKASNILSSSISSLASPFTSIGQSVLNFGAIAGGAALIGVTALTAGIGALGIAALGEVAKFERMSLSIQNLVAREISQGKLVEQEKQAKIQLTQKEVAELEKLKNGLDNEANDRDILTARIQEQKERIRQLTEQYGENGLVVIKERAELQGMELNLADLNGEIDTHNKRIAELTAKNGQLTTVLQKVRVGQMSMTEAMELASPRAQELIKWIQLLAIQSPFNSEDIQNAFQTALAYGFTSEQAQRLTEAEVDFTSATGKSAQAADLIALALGQIQARGKLSAQELRQLSEQGVGVNKILEDMGFSLDDVTNGLVPVDKFIEAVIKDMEVFKGAAKTQATTFAGLITSLGEIKSVGLREFFTSTFKSIQPYLAQFVDFLTNAALQTGSIRKLGDSLGAYVGEGLKTIFNLVAQFQRWGAEGIFAAMGFKSSSLFIAQIKSLWNLITSQGPDAKSIFEGIGGVIKYLQQNAFPMLTKAVSFVMNNFESFKGALIGIGAVLATGVFAAIIAGLLALLTPINLIIAAAALLGAAWMGNWFGIRDTLTTVWQTIQPILKNIVNIFDNVVQGFQAGGLKKAFNVILANVKLFGNTLSTKFQQLWPDIQAKLASNLYLLMNTIRTTIVQAFPGISGAFRQFDNLVKSFQKGGLFGTGKEGGLLAALGLDPAVVATVQNIISTITKDIQLLWTAFGSGDMSAIGTVGQFIGQQLSTIWTNYIQPQLNQWGVTFMDWVGVVYTNIPTVLTNLVTSISNFLVQAWPIVLSTLSTWGTQFWGWVLGAVQNAGNYLGQLINQIVTWANSPEVQNYMIQGGMIIGQHFMSSILTFLQQTAPALVTGLTYLIAGGLEYLAQGAVLLGQHLINSLNIFFQQGGPGLVTTLSYLVAGLLAAVATIAGTLFNLGTNLVAGILAGILNAFGANLQPATLSELGNILTGIGNNIVTIARTIGTQIVTGIRNGWTATVQTITDAFTNGVNAWADIITKSISEDVSPLLNNLGAKILPLLSEGLKTVTRWIKEATGFFNTLANAVKNFQLPDVLKPGSPPPFAIALSDIATSADQASMGIEKFQRLLTGVNTSSGEFTKTAAKIMQASIDFTKSLQMGGVGNIAQQARNVFTGFTAQIIRSGEAGQLTAASLQTKLIKYLNTYNKNVPATLNYFQQQGLTFEYLAEQLNKSFGDFMKSLRLQAITEDLGLAGRFASFGQAVTDRLNSDIETLQKVANGEAQYYHNELLTTVQAQELLNQKLADQVSVQKEINQLAQQQADLQFLQQQVDIIKLVEDRGLKAADIFKDVKFGLDASLPDLIKATSNVVQAMVDQINKDLQAGSPSKIMVNIGKMIDNSIGKGLIDNVSAPLSAARKMVEGVVSVASGQLAGAGQSVSNVVNNNFNMDVSTLASPQAVMQQYQVMRAMV